jgi:hypothetical protein
MGRAGSHSNTPAVIVDNRSAERLGPSISIPRKFSAVAIGPNRFYIPNASETQPRTAQAAFQGLFLMQSRKSPMIPSEPKTGIRG